MDIIYFHFSERTKKILEEIKENFKVDKIIAIDKEIKKKNFFKILHSHFISKDFLKIDCNNLGNELVLITPIWFGSIPNYLIRTLSEIKKHKQIHIIAIAFESEIEELIVNWKKTSVNHDLVNVKMIYRNHNKEKRNKIYKKIFQKRLQD